MDIKKSAIILNGFVHDFAAGIWLAAIVAIAVLHNAHLKNPEVVMVINNLEHLFFWGSVGAMVTILATGAGPPLRMWKTGMGRMPNGCAGRC